MHCLYCGANIPQYAQFCEACGRRQNPVVLPQSNAQPATSGQIKTLWPFVVFAIAALLLFIVFNIIPALLMVGLLFSWIFMLPRSSMALRQKLIWTFATLGLAVGIQVYQVYWQPEAEKSNPEHPSVASDGQAESHSPKQKKSSQWEISNAEFNAMNAKQHIARAQQILARRSSGTGDIAWASKHAHAAKELEPHNPEAIALHKRTLGMLQKTLANEYAESAKLAESKLDDSGVVVVQAYRLCENLVESTTHLINGAQ